MPFGRSKSVKPPLEPAALLDYAVRSLSAKMKSVRDLRRKLTERAEPGEAGGAAVESVLLKLKALGYLSDERFAADFTRLRKENDKFGRRRVQQGLMQKGIPNELVKDTLHAAYEDVDEVALARQYIERKRMKPPSSPDRDKQQKETARAMRRLIAAGFSTKTIWKVLRSWDAGLEEVDIAEE